MLDVAGWIIVAGMATLVATQIAGWSGTTLIVVAQALTPFVLLPSVPISVAAFIGGTWVLGAAAGAVALAFLALARPLLFPPRQAVVPAGTSPLRIFHSNLLYDNGRPSEVPNAVIEVDADVVTFTEYTAEHAALMAGSRLVDRYPFRIEHPERRRTGGSAIWSRFPLDEIDPPPARDRSSAAVIAGPQPMTVFVVHPPSPLMFRGGWHDELDRLRSVAVGAVGPVVLVGDFNADYWHPPFRRLLATGWRSAHQLRRRGFTYSWPTDRRPVPPFVRLDHVLVNDHVVVDAVRDVDVPGSDHRGLVVAVRPASWA